MILVISMSKNCVCVLTITAKKLYQKAKMAETPFQTIKMSKLLHKMRNFQSVSVERSVSGILMAAGGDPMLAADNH